MGMQKCYFYKILCTCESKVKKKRGREIEEGREMKSERKKKSKEEGEKIKKKREKKISIQQY